MTTSFKLQDAQELLKKLDNFDQTLKDEWSSVLSQWSNLKSTWQDQQYEKFEPFFEDLVETYDQLDQHCESYIEFIQQQIEIVLDTDKELDELSG